MNHPLEETTINDMAHSIFKKNGHTKLAKSFIEFIHEENDKVIDMPIEINTARRFVEFLISKKGYN